MTSKKTILTLAAVVIAGGFLLSAANTLAYRGNSSVLGPNCTQERHEAMEQAIEKNDYQAWKELMDGRGRITQVVNEENFAKFAQMHEYMEEGKYDAAAKIRTELGLGLQNGRGMGMGRFSR